MYRWANYHPVTNLVTKLGFLSIVAIGGYFVLQESSDFTMGKLIAFFLLLTCSTSLSPSCTD